jgi:hypothetical protein
MRIGWAGERARAWRTVAAHALGAADSAATESRQTAATGRRIVEGMTGFLIDAIAADRLDALRAAGVDDAGNAFAPFVNGDPDGAPLRCCLRVARTGERLALIAYRPDRTAGAYREVGPVFVHAERCGGYPERETYPSGFRGWRQVQRAYDAEGRIVDALLVEGANAEQGIAKLLADPAVVTVHSRNVLYGCYMFAINPVREHPAG